MKNQTVLFRNRPRTEIIKPFHSRFLFLFFKKRAKLSSRWCGNSSFSLPPVAVLAPRQNCRLLSTLSPPSAMPLSPLVAARRALVSLLLAFARAYNFTVEVNRDSEDKEVKAAVRKACRHVHPDKGGSTADQSRLNVERARVRLSTAAFLRTGTLEYRVGIPAFHYHL